MNVVINKLYTNNITTRYGDKVKFDVYITLPDSGSVEFKFSAWKGNWNKDWEIGATIDIPTLTDSRWKKSEYNGKEQFTLSAPPMDAGGGVPPSVVSPAQTAPVTNNSEVSEKLDVILKKLENIEVLLKMNEPLSDEQTIEKTEEEAKEQLFEALKAE